MQYLKIKSIKKIDSSSKRYDIETKKHHNFFANSILVHNSSVTFALINDEFHVCSRNLDLCDSDTNLYWRMARKYDIEEKLRFWEEKLIKWGYNKVYVQNIAIQGEIIGPGVQNNKYKLTENEVRFFTNAFNISNQIYYSYEETKDLYDYLNLPIVPIIHEYKDLSDFKNIDDLLLYADGKSKLNDTTNREGLVYTTKTEDAYKRIIFKTISNKFLLKNE